MAQINGIPGQLTTSGTPNRLVLLGFVGITLTLIAVAGALGLDRPAVAPPTTTAATEVTDGWMHGTLPGVGRAAAASEVTDGWMHGTLPGV
ncbi:MAG: hypothetical protein ABI622_07315, partial [Chloroflexota bacterium]